MSFLCQYHIHSPFHITYCQKKKKKGGGEEIRDHKSDKLKMKYTLYMISLGEIYINSWKLHFNYYLVNTEVFDSTLMILILALNHN